MTSVSGKVEPCWTGGGLPLRFVAQVGAVTPTANLGICQVREKIARRALSAMVGKNATASEPPLGPLMTTFYTYLHPTPSWAAEVLVTTAGLRPGPGIR